MKKRDDKTSKGLMAVAVVAGYVVLASVIYRFRHPDQSETELFMNLIDAMLWR